MVYKPKRMRWRTFHRLMDEVQLNNDAAMGYRLSRVRWLNRLLAERRASERTRRRWKKLPVMRR